MSPQKIYAVFVRQWFLIKNNPTRLASLFLWLLIDIIQWGFISKYLGTLGQATFSYIKVILGAIILWEFMSRIQQGIMMAFLEDIWSQNFINFFASPLKIKEYLSGLVLTSVMSGMIGFISIAIIAQLAFGYNILKIGFLLFPFLMVLFIFGISMGVFVSAMIFRFGPTAEWLGWPIPLVLSIFSGVFYPISTLPEGIRFVAKIIPASYVFESIRSILSSGATFADIGGNLIASFVLAFIYLILAYVIFIRVYRRNLRSGSLSRFSAEEV